MQIIRTIIIYVYFFIITIVFMKDYLNPDQIAFYCILMTIGLEAAWTTQNLLKEILNQLKKQSHETD